MDIKKEKIGDGEEENCLCNDTGAATSNEVGSMTGSLELNGQLEWEEHVP